MRIFVTGATGFLGSAIVHQLLTSGYQVLGLTRSEEGAKRLLAWGAEAHVGDIEDIDSLRGGAQQADGIIHTAFNHDFSRFVENCAADRQAIEAMGSALHGSARPIIITSAAGLGAAEQGQLASENHFNPDSANPRKASELAAETLIKQGVNVSIVRLPQVHNTDKQGLITPLIALAQAKGVSAYVGEGQHRWAAVHISDAARLFVLAMEAKTPGSRYHAVAEEGIPLKSIAEAIGRGMKIPVQPVDAEQAAAHFGWLAPFVSHDMSASSALTRQLLAWQPTGPRLLSDLQQINYAAGSGEHG